MAKKHPWKLSDEFWNLVEPLIPKRRPEKGKKYKRKADGGRSLPPHLEAGARRVRRDGGHLVEMAERGRVHDEGADGARGGGEKPYRPGKKKGRSGTSSWTGVGSRCR